MADHTASNATQAAVQAAVNAASDGDRVLIPEGTSATWSSGIATTKQIRIEARDYVPTPAGKAGAGTMTRGVTITNSVPNGEAVLQFTTGNTYHVGVGGIRFNEVASSGQSDKGPHIRIVGSGSKVPLIYDCAFQVAHRVGNAVDTDALVFTCRGGIIWNCYASGEGFNNNPANGPGPEQGLMVIKDVPREWTTASTMGAADTNGDINLYLEDSTFFIATNVAPDIDTNGRFVARHCVFDGTTGVMHGFSSVVTGRHVEYYDNDFLNTVDEDHPLAIGGFGRNYNRAFWLRGGTALFTNNFVSDNDSAFGVPSQFDSTHEGGGTYPVPMQIGWGHNGTSHVSDPVYIWNQTGGSAYAWSTDSPSYFQLNRDIFVNSGAKSGYSKYTYPHPLRSVVEGGGESPPSMLPLIIKRFRRK